MSEENQPPSDAAAGLPALLSSLGGQRLLGSAALSALLIALIYSTSEQQQPAAGQSPPPVLDIPSSPAVQVQSDDLLWGRFTADCWVRLKRGDETLIDRLFVAGETLSYRPDVTDALPDALYLGNLAAAEIYFRGERLRSTGAVRRGSTARIALPTTALTAPAPDGDTGTQTAADEAQSYRQSY